MDLNLDGRSAAVMASSDGLGRAIAMTLAREGAHVAICGRDADRLAAAKADVETCAAAGARVVALQLDVSHADAPQQLVDAAVGAFGGLDILVTNAGGPPAGPLLSFDDDAWQAAFDLTLRSVARACRAARPHLQASEQGRIVCIASSSVAAALSSLGFSNVFRPGIHGLVKTLAEELGPDGITVNLVAPGKIATGRVAMLDGKRGAASGRSAAEVRSQVEGEIPLGRYGEPVELAEVVTFLCSRAARYVSGTATLVDGGYVRAL